MNTFVSKSVLELSLKFCLHFKSLPLQRFSFTVELKQRSFVVVLVFFFNYFCYTLYSSSTFFENISIPGVG